MTRQLFQRISTFSKNNVFPHVRQASGSPAVNAEDKTSAATLGLFAFLGMGYGAYRVGVDAGFREANAQLMELRMSAQQSSIAPGVEHVSNVTITPPHTVQENIKLARV